MISVYSQEDEFFGIFPQDYYDPRDYGEFFEYTNPDKLTQNSTNKEIPLTIDNDENTTQNYLPDVKSLDINFIAAGDWNCNKETEKTVKKITQLKPELVIGLGDYTFEEISPQCWFDISKPIHPKMKIAIGNHDLDYQSSYYQLLDHYNLRKPYYSFNFQNIHFLTISSEHPFDKQSEQYEFIKNDLAESLQDPTILWRIVFLHKPMYTSAKFDEKESENLKNTFHKLFEKYQIDLVLSGHTQYYQRSLPISYNKGNPLYPIITDSNNNQYTNNDGVIFATAGTAGDDLHDIVYSPPYYINQQRQFGFLNFDLTNNGKTLVGSFYDTDDLNILDKFVITKDKTGKKTLSEESSGTDSYDENNFFLTSEGKDNPGIINKNPLF